MRDRYRTVRKSVGRHSSDAADNNVKRRVVRVTAIWVHPARAIEVPSSRRRFHTPRIDGVRPVTATV